jgi:hypothetical protein
MNAMEKAQRTNPTNGILASKCSWPASKLKSLTMTLELDSLSQESDVALEVKEDRVPSSWILLDNQSTVDVFHHAGLLKNIRTGDGHMDIHCNSGVTSTNLIGDLPGYGEVWYHPNGIANILSLKRVKTRGHRVTYDSSKANEFHMHKADGTIRIFKESPCGLYYSDTSIREAGPPC